MSESAPDFPAVLVPDDGLADLPTLPKLPRVSAAHANDGSAWGSVSEPLAHLLRYAMLPPEVLAHLVVAAGPGGVLHAGSNGLVGETLWCALYSAASGIGRSDMVERRLLSGRQRTHVVSVARERSPYVLCRVVGQLDQGELEQLAARPLPTRSRESVEWALGQRRAGVEAIRRPDGRGAVRTLNEPDERVRVEVGSMEVSQVPSPVNPKRQAATATVVDYLLERLGTDVALWGRLGRALVSPPDLTWAELCGAVTDLDDDQFDVALRLAPTFSGSAEELEDTARAVTAQTPR